MDNFADVLEQSLNTSGGFGGRDESYRQRRREERRKEQEAQRPDRFRSFLKSHSASQVEQVLNGYIIGQPELTRDTADFLCYHALRQLYPHLPSRPMLVSGPSGSGKTQVWRVVQQLYGSTFSIRIADGSKMTCDGWSGNYKVTTFLDETMSDGGILVVDEFDKLACPSYSSHGENISHSLQGEMLKMAEGDFVLADKRTNRQTDMRRLGLVFTGAFIGLTAPREQSGLGFLAQPPKPQEDPTEEDFIRFGVMPELMGRIATRTRVHPLSRSSYVQIITGEHSRVRQLLEVLEDFGVTLDQVISPGELEELIDRSRTNFTGARWVSAQVESRILRHIRTRALDFPAADPEQLDRVI